MRTLLLISLIVACACCASCETPQRVAPPSSAQFGNADTLPAEFAQVLHIYENAWRAKDADALSALFAEDGFIMPHTSPPIRGRDNIRKAYAGAGGPLHLHALAWAMDGDIGYIIGVYAHQPGPPEFATGKYTLTLKRDPAAGVWQINSDMDNGNQRPAPPPPPESQP